MNVLRGESGRSIVSLLLFAALLLAGCSDEETEELPDGARIVSTYAENAAGERVRHGTSTWYRADGTIFIQSEYSYGKAEGLEERWDPDGTLVEQCHYRNGERHGLRTQYQPWGVTVYTNYQDGYRHGPQWVVDDERGILLTQATYVYERLYGCRMMLQPPTGEDEDTPKEEWDRVFIQSFDLDGLASDESESVQTLREGAEERSQR